VEKKNWKRRRRRERVEKKSGSLAAALCECGLEGHA
jgi:hypothetical protein